ncbi:hypothetical protein R84B8_00375 [Treponema sp. R8-4-B8]
MTNTRHEENVLVVFAVEEYARRHGISAYDTLSLFLKYGITESIRQCYETLHTQDIYECVSFAEDILKRNECKIDYMNYYEIIVYWSIKDNAFIAEVPELAGCMADGKTYIEAVQNAEIAIDEWIEAAQLTERAIPVAKGRLVY